jgi:hypothetical protein
MGRPRKETRETAARAAVPSDEYVSQFYIDPSNLDQEKYHYRWVETHCMNAETTSLGTALRAGYEPVALADLPEFAKTAELMASIRGRSQKDEYVRQGDQILMRCTRAIYNAARKAERKDAKQQMNRLEWAESSQSIKAPTFVDPSRTSYSRTQELSKAAAKAFAEDDD